MSRHVQNIFLVNLAPLFEFTRLGLALESHWGIRVKKLCTSTKPGSNSEPIALGEDALSTLPPDLTAIVFINEQKLDQNAQSGIGMANE